MRGLARRRTHDGGPGCFAGMQALGFRSPDRRSLAPPRTLIGRPQGCAGMQAPAELANEAGGALLRWGFTEAPVSQYRANTSSTPPAEAALSSMRAFRQAPPGSPPCSGNCSLHAHGPLGC